MGREHIYRARNFDNGEWVYGDLITITDREDVCGIKEFSLLALKHLCNKATLGEYTGLTDKNGVKIFEGDIVRYGETVHKVVFETRNGTAYFGIVVYPDETWSFGYSVPADKMEVIGNIHDTPELLKGD